MILGFDIGNTSTSMGVYCPEFRIPVHLFRYPTDTAADAQTLSGAIRDLIDPLFPGDTPVTGIVFSSVVTEAAAVYHETARNVFGVRAVEAGPDIALNITIDYETPETLGPDRIVNAAAARRDYGGNCLIIDLGTATTLTVLLEEGVFTGGIIAPGVGSTMEALAARASKLMEVPLEAPPAIVGKNTMDCIKSGFFHGWAAMMEGFATRISAFYGRDFTIIITGGFARRFAGSLGIPCIIDPILTMKGLKVIYDLNRPR